MTRLTGQVAIVTGGGTGIGGATARRLAEEGARVLIADIDMQLANENVDRIKSAGGTAETLQADAGSHADIKAMVDRAVQLWGGLNILVNNAYSPSGADTAGGATEVSEEAWDRGMAVLVKSMFLGAKYAVPHMRQAGGGSVVNLSSVHGLLTAPKSLIYEAGKFAVIGVTKQMACDYGPDNIRVNAICPGLVVTGMTESADAEAVTRMKALIPMRRDGLPEEIAAAVVFLASDEASYITGIALPIDGGYVAQ